MSEMLLSWFEPLKNIHPVVYTLVIACVPLIELRGSIPVALALGLSAWQALVWSVVGSMIPAFFVIPLFDFILKWLDERQYWPALTNFLNKHFVTKAQAVSDKHADIEGSDKKAWQKELLKFWAIVIFVAIPLPGTGVYTGAAIASLIKMPFPKALLAVFIGDVIAGVIVTALSVGVMALF